MRDQLVRLLRNPFHRRRPKDILWALRDVNFSVEEGEVVGIIGRNGAGKSTLLKILSKITYPTSGRVRTRGRVASLLEVGTGFHEELTGRENVYLNGSILGMKKREVDEKFEAIVSFSGVERFVDTPIKRYSSGMRMRLGFSVAAHLEPDVLIVDEVLAVGDAAFQKKCISAMQDMRGGGRTVLFVSHNMAAVENLCTRGIWIANGNVRLDGPTHEVIEAYMASFASADGAVQRTHRRRGAPRFGRDPLHARGILVQGRRAADGHPLRQESGDSPALPRQRGGRASELRYQDVHGNGHADHRHQYLAARPGHLSGGCRHRLHRSGDRFAQPAAGSLLLLAVGGLLGRRAHL